ncbi:hypothetical protein [Mycobacterium sp. IDR2000157661]|uniref:hypothetical protein n=1 Tax=Mycobacterium sp. IDR2000157661 TaxID=2867005 RepID=UPI001EEB53D3|nr:hypothetical protein [Mycobacterium sp. IDR2000157661]ULE33246.1 hypothetical protein K3G64_24940 [Mycobacterium sp. IDR2000157661]
MTRLMITASAALFVALPLAPQAGADAGQVVLIDDGAVRCLVSANDLERGGGPIATCQRSDGQPWGQSPWETSKFNNLLNVPVVRGTGELYWEKGTVPSPQDPTAGSVVIGPGETYRTNGWTVQDEGLKTRFTYDATNHGITVDAQEVRQF